METRDNAFGTHTLDIIRCDEAVDGNPRRWWPAVNPFAAVVSPSLSKGTDFVTGILLICLRHGNPKLKMSWAAEKGANIEKELHIIGFATRHKRCYYRLYLQHPLNLIFNLLPFLCEKAKGCQIDDSVAEFLTKFGGGITVCECV